MGKIRKQKSRLATAANPFLSIPNLEVEGDHYGPIEAISEQLQSAQIEEKINGLQSFAVLALNREKAESICKSGLIRIASPLLFEKNEAVRDAASGALRNLSVCGPEVCDLMVEGDVLTPLLAILVEYIRDNKWTPTFDKNMGNQIDLHSDIFLQTINLLRNLCESSPTALEAFNQSQIIDGLLRCLDYKLFGLEISISVAQCLLVVSENNSKLWSRLNDQVEILQRLLQISGGHGEIYLSTLSAGILCNVPALAAAYSTQLFNTLNRSLSIDSKTELCTLNGLVDSEEPSHQQIDIDMDVINEETEEESSNRRRRQELPTPFELTIIEVFYLLDSQKLAAEIISNLCSSEEENWSDVEEDFDDSEDECVEDYGNADLGLNENEESNLPKEALEAIKSLQLVNKIWQRAQPINDCFDPVLTSNRLLINKLKNMRISCLLCLQNLCAALSLEDLGGYQAIYNVWVNLGLQVFKGSKDNSLMEPITSLMRASLDLLKPCKELFNQMTQSDLELILSGVEDCTVADIRTNWLSMLGTLGCLLPENLVKIITAFFLEKCVKEDNICTISQALDGLMDTFAENDWHQIMLELNMLEKIKIIEQQFKGKVRQQRRDVKENFAVVETVKLNLSRFVKYIEDELTKCNKIVKINTIG